MRHARATNGVRFVHSEDYVLVRVEGHWATKGQHVAVDCGQTAVRALAEYEPKLHQSAGRIVDEHEQGAGLATILEPSVIAAVNLDQFAKALTPQSWLMESLPLLARKP